MSDTFICALCGGEFEKGQDEESALAELKELWGDVSPDDCELVCDDCWNKIKPPKENDR